MLEPDATDEETSVITPSPVTSTQSPLSSRADSILGLGYMTTHPSRVYSTSPTLVAKLCHVYNRQVDPVIKIMHKPTLNAYLVDCKSFLDYDLHDPRPAALRAAVCYAAVASMMEEQCQATFSCPKLKVLPEFRDACDVALNKAGLLTTKDMTVLQAFVLYLVSSLSFLARSYHWLVQRLSSKSFAYNKTSGGEASRGSQPCGMDFDRCGSEDSESLVATPRATHHLRFLLSTANEEPPLVLNMCA